MDDDAGGGDRFHRNEAISAVQDEDPYLGDEDYEDYDDLYNDVNVGDGFLHSVPPRRDDLGFPKVEEKKPLPPLPQQPPPQHHPQQTQPPLPQVPPQILPENVSIPGIAGETKPEGGGFPSMAYRGPNEPVAVRAPVMPNIVGVGVRPDLGQFGGKSGEGPGQYGNPNFGNEGFGRQGGGGSGSGAGGGGVVGGPVNYNANVNGGTSGGVSGSGGTVLFVGDLHWWTTDADLESELCKYGQVKEVKFFDEKASGKSKGYCQVDFYDPMAAAACKEGMNGHLFNGRPCVVAFASPHSIRRMGEAQLSKNQAFTQPQSAPAQGRGRGGSGIPTGGNYGGRGGNWGRGGPAGGRGQMGNIRNRMGPAGGRGIMGNGGMINPPPPPPVLNPGNMFGQGFDPTGYGAMMGRMGGGYGGFPAGPAGPPFTGMMPSFPTMVAPHVNPAFFGRGMVPGGVGMWPDPNAGGWGLEEQSSYGEDAASDHQYGEGSHGKDRVSDRDWSGAPERKHRDDRERDMGPGPEMPERRHHDDREISRDREREREREKDREREREREKERDRYRDDRERHGDLHRHRERESHRDDEWDRGRSSRPRSKSREYEYSKRRRVTPE